MPDVNLNPFTAESAAIQRRLQMAQALGQQALQPMDLPQQAGVRASPYAGLAKILQAYNAAQAEKSATQEYKDLAERYQAGNRAEMGSFLEAMQGAPAKELAGPAPQGAPQGVSQTEVTQPYTDAQGVQYKGGEPIQGGYIQPAQAPDRQRAMALALGSQNPTLQGAGGALLSQMFAQDKIKDFKVELVNGKTHRIGYTETGKRTDLGEIEESVSPDTAARLKQDKEQADRAFGQLSASQKATLANDAARLNISAQQLFFDTGIKAGGGSFVNPLAQPPAPTAQPNVAPNAPPMRPPVAGALTPTSAPPAPPVAGAPVNAPVASAYTPLSQLSPKAQQEVAKAAALEQIVPKPLTESQGNATAYGMRMAEANKILTDLEKKGVTNTGVLRSAIGGTVGLTPFIGDKLQEATNALINPLPTFLGGPSAQQQQVDQARRNFITAVLRKESGAAIGASEFANEEKKYFPQTGDTDTVIKQKQDARELAIKAMGIQAGPQGARNIAPQGDPLGLR
jgi:hypothetical protein